MGLIHRGHKKELRSKEMRRRRRRRRRRRS